jgi:hypothetical protein
MGSNTALRISLSVAVVAAVAILLKQALITHGKHSNSGAVRVGEVICGSFPDQRPACCKISETACGLIAITAVVDSADFADPDELGPLVECGGCGCLASDTPPCCHGEVPYCYSH